MDTQPKVSIVIPVYNEEKIIKLCLDSLMEMDYPGDRLEILLVDNASVDSTAEIIKQYPVKYIFEGKKGRSLARNTGIKQATGDIIAFTDADCIVAKDWLKNLVEGFKTENTGCCAGKSLSYKPSNLIEEYFDWIVKKQEKEKLEFFENYLIGPLFATCNLACRRSVFEEIGFFDEVLYASEDVDLIWRINLKGYQINYVPGAVVYHKRRDKLKDLPEVFFKYMYWQYYLVKKYERIIGISFSWPMIFSKIFRGIFLYVINLIKFNFKKSLFNLFILALLSMQLLTAFYIWIKIKLGKINDFKPLNFEPLKIIWRWDEKGSVMILNLEHKSGYNLDGLGARIWELLSEHKTKAEIINRLKYEYETGESDIESDVNDLIGELQREKLIPNTVF